MTIEELLEELKKLNIVLTSKELANDFGIREETLSRAKSSKRQINLKYIKKIEHKYNINLINKKNSEIKKIDLNAEYIDGDYYYDVFGSCGNGAFVLSENKEKIRIPLNCFNSPVSKVKQYSVINAIGNSMEPFIYDRDRLIVQHFELGEKIQDDKVYVFCYDEQIMVKRLYYNVDEIIVKSDNPNPIFKVKYIKKEEMNNIQIIGQIVGLMRDCR